VRTYLGVVSEITDPIFAHAAAFGDGKTTVVFLSLDVVIIEFEYAGRIRALVSEKTGVPVSNIMVCGTHNHACPAVVERGSFKKEERFIESMIAKGAETAIRAFNSMEDSVIETASGFEARAAFNRRYIKRDGTIVTQPSINTLSSDILCSEGPADHELIVICAKNPASGKITGVMVNFACHAVHLMGKVSAGYPGVLKNLIREKLGSGTGFIFLNGACGNLIHKNYSDPGQIDTKEATGAILAKAALELIEKKLVRASAPSVETVSKPLTLKCRDYSDLEACVDDPSKFVNVFQFLVTGGWYKHSLEKLREFHKATGGKIKISAQVFKIGDTAFAAFPCEYFTELSLRIKEQSKAPKVCVVTLANGWLGYVPSKANFRRKGGHESSTAFWSKMSHDSGDRMAAKAVSMINSLFK
jgi:hypothetical protein